jgi:tetratricopeptide (TPR) repeat protein
MTVLLLLLLLAPQGQGVSERERDDLRTFARELQLAGEVAKAEALLSKLIQTDQRDARSWLVLGQLLHDQGYFQLAVRACERALDIDGSLREASAYRALALARLGDHQQAERLFVELLDEPDVPRRQDLALGYVEMLVDANRLDQALGRADTLIAGNPTLGQAHYWRARILFRQGRLDDSIAAGERALGLVPDSVPLRHLLLRIYSRAGRSKEAAEQVAWLEKQGDKAAVAAGGR